MADEIITSTQPDSVGNLLGDDIGVFDHYSSSPFQAEPLKPQPSAPQQPMSSGPNASKPLVDDFGLDPHITTTSSSTNKPVVNPMGGTPAPAAPNSSSSFTPGELTSNNPISDDDEEYDDDDDYRLNNHHQHHPKEGNNHQPNDDDDDGYDDREEELNYQKNGAPYQDNPAFSDYSDSEFHHHHSEARREPSPLSALPVDSGVVTNNEPHAKSGGYEDSDELDKSDDEDVEDIEEEDVVVRAPAVEPDQHPHHLDRHHDDDHDKEEVDSLNEDNVVVLDNDEDGGRDDDDEDDAHLVYSASPAAGATTTSATESPEITEPPFKSFDTEASPSHVSSEISSSPFPSSAAPPSSMTGGAVAEAVQEGPSAFDLAEEGYPNPSQAMSTTTTTSYAPPSPSAPPAVATFSPPSPSDNATSTVISQITGDDDASGFGSAVTPVRKGQVSPSAAGTEILKNDHLNYDDDDDDEDDDPEMPSDPPYSTSLSSSQTSAPQPSAPPQPVEADLFSPPITNSTNTPPQASSSTLYNSHSTREPEPFFTAESNVVQTSPLITDQPNEVQSKPTLEGPWLKNIDPKASANMKKSNPKAVRKEKLRQAKLAEEAKVLTGANKQANIDEKKDKAYCVQVQIPVTPEPILLQSKSPLDSAVMNVSQAAAPEPVVDSTPVVTQSSVVEATKPIEPEPVVMTNAAPPAESEPLAVEGEPVTELDTAIVAQVAPAAQSEPVVALEAVPAQLEPVVAEVAAPAPPGPVVAEEAAPAPPGPVAAEEAAPAPPEPVVAAEAAPAPPGPVAAEEAAPAPPEPVAAEEAAPAPPEPVVAVEVAPAPPGPVVAEPVPAAEEPLPAQIVMAEETTPVQSEPVVVDEAPASKSEVILEEVQKPVEVDVLEPQIVDEVHATPLIPTEIVSAPPVVEKEEPAPSPKVEAPPEPVEEEKEEKEEENIELIPAARRQKEDAEPEVTLRDIPGLSTTLSDLDEDLDEYLRKELYRHLHGQLDGCLEDGIAEFTGAEYYAFLDLIYWRDVKKTGVVFGSMLFILLSLAIFSVLSVVAYLSLAILSVTLSFRVYKNIMQAVQKSGDGHPFKEYLEWDLELNDQKTQKVVKLVMKHFNATVRELRRLFLVEDLVDSIKFGLLLWVLTYIGSWFNGMTLIINSVVIVFTLPKIYETYKVQIDNYLAMARSQFNKILQHPGVQSKLPFLKKKSKAQ